MILCGQPSRGLAMTLMDLPDILKSSQTISRQHVRSSESFGGQWRGPERQTARIYSSSPPTSIRQGEAAREKRKVKKQHIRERAHFTTVTRCQGFRISGEL